MTTEHVTKDIEQAIAAEKAVLYFSAPWCGPCKSFGPIIESFKTDNPSVVVCKIDIDQSRDLTSLYTVRSVPTTIFLEHGAEVARQVGSTDRTTVNILAQV